MDMNTLEIEIHLLDRELPTKVIVNNGWTAEYVSRMVARKFLGIKAIALEVRHSIVVRDPFGGEKPRLGYGL